jgi:4-amino-4-deoxy-L-arabinose transferase-like glycosyltransferase
MPLSAVLVLLVSVGLLGWAAAAARARRTATALVLILAGALSILLYAASERALNEWDERYHVLVAKHLISHPLMPTLYDNAVLPFDYRDWTANQVWLHKPPFALWLIAASLRLFGITELAARLPSVLLSTLAVGLTFGIGRRLFDSQVGLLASAFHAVNGMLVALASGRAPTDHVDAVLIAMVELGIYLAIRDAERPQGVVQVALGVVLGLAVLTKWYPGLLIVPIWLALVAGRRTFAAAALALLIVGAAATVIVLPWVWHITTAFPREAISEWRYDLSRVGAAVEGHSGGNLVYLADLPNFFSELVYIPLAWAVAMAVTMRSRAFVIVAMWFAIPYLVFSLAHTKMTAYVMIAAPAIFLIEARFWSMLAAARLLWSHRLWRTALLVTFAFLPARHILRPGGPFTIRDRHPSWVRQIESLRTQVSAPNPVVFNVPRPIETMFYVPWPAYERVPSLGEVDALSAQGYSVLIFDPDSGGVKTYGRR